MEAVTIVVFFIIAALIGLAAGKIFSELVSNPGGIAVLVLLVVVGSLTYYLGFNIVYVGLGVVVILVVLLVRSVVIADLKEKRRWKGQHLVQANQRKFGKAQRLSNDKLEKKLTGKTMLLFLCGTEKLVNLVGFGDESWRGPEWVQFKPVGFRARPFFIKDLNLRWDSEKEIIRVNKKYINL